MVVQQLSAKLHMGISIIGWKKMAELKKCNICASVTNNEGDYDIGDSETTSSAEAVHVWIWNKIEIGKEG